MQSLSMAFLLPIFFTAVYATRECSPELPTCADVCNEEKWIKKLEICVEKAERLHTFCLVRSCNKTVSMDDFKEAGYKFLAGIVGAYSRVQNIDF
ncbi:unnamed protein product [Oikopleura dioica]|uniref:Uncharacterized protein n=1 Tax=Oikopleura dioica TaxID=34765 RepID=E4YNS1_OIKDI|nr:unnamed protein product [Oikopleura dioica]